LSNPELQLNTLFELNAAGRIARVREPGGASGPWCALIRGFNAFVQHLKGRPGGACALD